MREKTTLLTLWKKLKSEKYSLNSFYEAFLINIVIILTDFNFMLSEEPQALQRGFFWVTTKVYARNNTRFFNKSFMTKTKHCKYR